MKKIKDYLKEFQDQLKFENKSPGTMKSYRNQILRFTKDIGDLKVNKIRKRDIINWIIKLKETSRDGYTINCLWAMRSLLKFLRKEKKLRIWCFDDLKIPKRKETNCVKYLTNDEVKKVLNFFSEKNDIYSIRMNAYLSLLLNTGLRPSEALKLNRDDVRDEAEIIGKGNKERKVYLNDKTQGILRGYLKHRTDNHPALFTTHCKARRLAFNTVGDLFRKSIKKVGMEKRVTLHMMRRTFATNLFRNGCQLEYVQIILGHSKPETTKKYYTAIRQEDAQEAQKKYLNYEN